MTKPTKSKNEWDKLVDRIEVAEEFINDYLSDSRDRLRASNVLCDNLAAAQVKIEIMDDKIDSLIKAYALEKYDKSDVVEELKEEC